MTLFLRSGRSVRSSRLLTRGTRGIVVAAAALAGAAVPTTLMAQTPQVQAVDPYCIAITSDNVPLKGGAGLVYYAVAMLRSGQVLKVDGTAAGGWLRVEYPKGMRAFVKAEDATAEDGGKSIKLSKTTNLYAVNISGGERGHWWYMVEDKPAGSKFPVVEALKTPDGKTYGYLVPAPTEARGYVKAESTRRATADEAAGFEKSLADGSAAPPPVDQSKTSKPAAKPDKSTLANGGQTAPKTPETNPSGAGAPAGGGVVKVAGAPGDGGSSQPAITSQDGGAAPADSPESSTPAPPPAPAPKAAERKTGTVESMQSLYEQVQGGKDAELSSVIAEFERSINALGNGAEDRRQAEFLKARLEVLKLRQAVLTSKQNAERASKGLSEQQSKLTEQVKSLEKSRNYAMVGRLVPSTVYDGKRLPKMYRIQSLEPGFARTVGYLSPASNEELDSRLGRVIGVVGDTRFDESLRLNIITPKRVDVLSPTDIPAANPPAEKQDPVADVNADGEK